MVWRHHILYILEKEFRNLDLSIDTKFVVGFFFAFWWGGGGGGRLTGWCVSYCLSSFVHKDSDSILVAWKVK